MIAARCVDGAYREVERANSGQDSYKTAHGQSDCTDKRVRIAVDVTLSLDASSSPGLLTFHPPTMHSTLGILFFLFALLTSGDSSIAKRNGTASSVSSRADSIAIVRTASRLHDAFKSGDSATVENLVAPDLRVLEGGEVENKAQYLAHHLAADIEFAKAVQGERILVSYAREGNVAWLVSTSTATGKFNAREINSVGAELIILSRTQKGWKIRAVHWSSARRQSP